LWSEFYAQDFVSGAATASDFYSYYETFVLRARFLQSVQIVRGNIISETEADCIICPSHPEFIDLGVGAQHAIRHKVSLLAAKCCSYSILSVL
jgi:hypothetical protein